MKKLPVLLMTGIVFGALLCTTAAAEDTEPTDAMPLLISSAPTEEMPLLISPAPNADFPILIAPAPQAELPLVSLTFHQGGTVLRDAEGGLAANLTVAVTDEDEDGALTVYDAMVLAHRYYYGAEDGFACEETDFGYSMTKIWGITEGVGAFYHNGAMPWTDVRSTAVADGDQIDVILYGEDWSDVYAAFDQTKYTAGIGTTVPMELTYSAYDENWNAYLAPLSGGTVTALTADGTAAESAEADENGNAFLSVQEAGTYQLALSSDGMTLDSYAELTVLPYTDLAYGAWYTDTVKKLAVFDMLPKGSEFLPEEDTYNTFAKELLSLGRGGNQQEYTLTRGKVLSLLNAVYGSDYLVETYADADLSMFADADTLSEQARARIAWAYERGILSGRLGADGKLYADHDAVATRAETAALIARARELIGAFRHTELTEE